MRLKNSNKRGFQTCNILTGEQKIKKKKKYSECLKSKLYKTVIAKELEVIFSL